MDATPRAHPLTLRVMQLAKPGFARHDPVGYDEEGLALTRNVLHAENPRHYAPANVTEALQLPSSQGKVYLGESFSAFINICNDGHDVVTNVSLKVEMQTASQRHTSLADPESCRASKLERTQTLQTTIRHEIRSLGTHALLCAVSYTLLNGERRTFRKSFNFEVNQPLDVIPHCTTIQNTIVLEVQVKNQMPHPIHFQSIKFTPQSAFAVQDCNATLCQDGKTRSVFHGFQSVEPKESRSYLYKLTPAEGQYFEFRRRKAIGKLDVMWRSSMGEFGHLQTSQLERPVPPVHDLELHATNAPSAVTVGAPFEVECDVINFRDVKVDASLNFDLQQVKNSTLRKSYDIILEKSRIRM
ncbi:hypothetical protein PTSG_02475 [Salpingoeca rosetta]|uniref:Trafficking protein particle complex subunit 13 n=1 Tax=Salpingoeca rosetta (strain ATCC 50818 / BSB-021) TaxID=946362 RepID=F2U2B0_SALR5|nr:uncharacterized protein PTSG_02475 [Salpingoeca rosetta]EGD81762.1 hypothetical protein PTSG_02475 [Salpingoeca rosetta]|eukprot:XP_004996966.1 hypothetical protein PTSG_02475 [Salpingoeca rosetta]